MLKILLIGSFAALMVGRVMIPVEDAPITPHLVYEIAAHWWCGFMLAIWILPAFERKIRVFAFSLFWIASIVELVAFLANKS